MQTFANFISNAVAIYTILIIVAVILTWVRLPYSYWLSRIRDAVDAVTSPYLRLFRRFVRPLGGLDLSPLVALIVLQVVGGTLASAVAGL